ncbi:MAG: DUF2514 family protein [Myxococcaceae bacterium]
MKSGMWKVGAAVLALSGAAFAEGRKEHKEYKESAELQKACDDLSAFRTSVDSLASVGPETTVGQIKQDTKQAREDLKKFEKSASKVARPETDQVRERVERLRSDAQKIPDSATAAEAQQLISNDIDQVTVASRTLERKLNCGMGGAGTGGAGMDEGQVYPETNQPAPTE